MSAIDQAMSGLRKRSIANVELQDDSGRRRTVQLDDLSEEDRALAEKFGYKPVFKRDFGYLATFSFAVSISGLFSTIATTFIYPLQAGGSASAVWSWLISGAGCMCIACSVAELVSAYPTCGGLYYTVSRLAPRAWVPSISWVVGWINVLGQVAGVASSEYGSAQILLAAIAMASGVDEAATAATVTGEQLVPILTYNFQFGANTTVGVMAGLTVLCGLVNSFPTSWMAKMTSTYVIFHVLVLVSCAIAILVKTEHHHSTSYVFTDVTSVSGWQPVGFSFLFGFLSVSWTMTDYDATAHIAEEISQPEIKAPWAISLAMLFTYIGGFLFNIALCYCMGDPEQLLLSSVYQPVGQLFYNSLGPAGGVFYTICAFIILQFVCFTATQSLARTVFAFSRDRLLPFSNIWVKINRYTGTPIYAVWFSVFWCIAIDLIGLGSYAAVGAVFSVTAIALDWSYCIPIFCKLVFGKFQPGPWHMGKIGYFVNAWACIWTLFVSIIFILPTLRPVTALNMNYAIAIMALILLFALVYWYAGGRRWYTGPLIEAEIQSLNGDSSSNDGIDGKEQEKLRERNFEADHAL